VADLSRAELHRLARMGAEARLQELRQEEAALRQAFPELFRGARAAGQAPAATGAKKSTGKRRYRMSPEQKKAVSERMRKYWAARRRQKKEKAAK
jgi:hypothetical protein